MTKRVISFALAMLMALSVCACTNKVDAYREKMNVIIQEVSEMDADISATVDALNTALQNEDEEAYNTNLAKLKEYSESLKEKYIALANVEAPEEFAEDQQLLKQYADELGKMLDASMELYDVAYEYNVKGNVDEEGIQKVVDLQEEIMQYESSTTNFDNVLNKLMGYGE